MDKVRKRLILIRFTKIFIAILIIPTIIFGVFCTIVLSNTKLNGGLPSIFGYYVVQIPDNSFYNSQLNLYRAGDYRMFQSIQSSDYRVGDMIAYYVGSEDAEDQIVLESYEWIENLSRNWQDNAPDNLIDDFSAYQKNKINHSGTNTYSTDTATQFDASENGGAEVKLGKIERIGIGYDADEVAYVIYSIYGTPTDLIDKPILAFSVIGLSISSPDFIISLILYCSSTFSFIILLLLPCALLITFQITNLTLGAKQMRLEKNYKKRMLRESEIKSQMEEYYSVGKTNPESVGKIKLKKARKSKVADFPGRIGDANAKYNFVNKNPQRFYNKEQLEKIRKDLLSNKKYQVDTFDYEEDDELDSEHKKNLTSGQHSQVQAQNVMNAEPIAKETRKSSIEEIPEDIIQTYGLKIKCRTESKAEKDKTADKNAKTLNEKTKVEKAEKTKTAEKEEKNEKAENPKTD